MTLNICREGTQMMAFGIENVENFAIKEDTIAKTILNTENTKYKVILI